jgi:hypothetical protein
MQEQLPRDVRARAPHGQGDRAPVERAAWAMGLQRVSEGVRHPGPSHQCKVWHKAALDLLFCFGLPNNLPNVR